MAMKGTSFSHTLLITFTPPKMTILTKITIAKPMAQVGMPGAFAVMMPVMEGIEATKEIRALERPDAKTVPIIAMTANAFAEDRQMCLEAGMNDHVSKPIDMIALNNAIRKIGN